MKREDFAAAIDEAIVKATKNQTDDIKFVTTLRDYIIGLIQVQPLERSKLKAMLREFIPEGLSAFVDWLLKFVKEVGLPDTERPKPILASSKSRVRSTVMLAGSKAADDQGDYRSEQREGMAARASREPAHRDKGPQEQGKSRSRSPAAKLPISMRVARSGQHALFSEAIRRVEGTSAELAQNNPVVIKQEQDSPDVIMVGSAEEIKQEAAVQLPPNGQTPTVQLHEENNAGSADDEMQQEPRSPEEFDDISVVITNVHFDATPEQLGIFFHERCGSVIRVTILKNSHGMPKGYAYMQLASAQAAADALGLDGIQFMGRTLKVLRKLRKPPTRSIPHWLFRSMSSLMPFVWGSTRHGSMLGSHTGFPSQGFSSRHVARRFAHHGPVKVPAGAWIRGISDPLQLNRDR
eukprot:jgi/Ulvmu1/1268/UM109_0066.1